MHPATEPAQHPIDRASRRAHVRPLPGGGRRYKQTLDAFVRWIAAARPPRAPEAPTQLLETIGLVQREGERLELTDAGHAYCEAPRPELLFERLHASYEGFLEALVLAGSRDTTRRTRELLSGLVDRPWKAAHQVSHRRCWLRSLGLTAPTAAGDALTPLGRRVIEAHEVEVREIRQRIEDLFEDERAADLARSEAFEADYDDDNHFDLDEPAAPSMAVVAGSEVASTPLATAVLPPAWGALRLDLTAEHVRPHLGSLDLPPALIERVTAALSSGKHLLLAGPPGTGKTELALAISEAARAAGHCNGALSVTASSDWTTFDTVGGNAIQKDGTLRFRPGVFLAALDRREWLVIDELNRADTDRAFGELLTVLAGRDSTTPYSLDDGRLVSVGPSARATHHVPPTFRLIATMNTWDRTSLFRMSYALERRFAIVHVGIPEGDRYARLLALHAGCDAADPPLDPATLAAVQRIFCSAGILAHRPVGPAVAIDMIRYLRRRGAAEGLAEATAIYLLPQLEGLDPEASAAARERITATLAPICPPFALAELDARFRELLP